MWWVRYHISDDLALLREVVSLNPFADQSQWGTIAENVTIATGRDFWTRSVKERLLLMLRKFLHNERQVLKQSGTEEGYTERDQLLHQAGDLSKEFGRSLRPSTKRVPKRPSCTATARSTDRTSTQDGRVAAAMQFYEEPADPAAEENEHIHCYHNLTADRNDDATADPTDDRVDDHTDDIIDDPIDDGNQAPHRRVVKELLPPPKFLVADDGL
ncbi:uncharacterized protein LOC144123334 [Amblyomma americanum]